MSKVISLKIVQNLFGVTDSRLNRTDFLPQKRVVEKTKTRKI